MALYGLVGWKRRWKYNAQEKRAEGKFKLVVTKDAAMEEKEIAHVLKM